MQTWVVILNWDGYAVCGFLSCQKTNMKQWGMRRKENTKRGVRVGEQ